MDQLMEMATKAGMSPEQGKEATGGVFSMIKKQLDSGDYQKILDQVPGLGDAVKEHEESASRDAGGGGGGLMGQAMGMFGGGGDGGGAGGLPQMLAGLQKQGVDVGQVNKFLPQVVGFVKDKCGVDLGSQLGVSGDTSAGGGDAQAAVTSALGGLGGMFGK